VAKYRVNIAHQSEDVWLNRVNIAHQWEDVWLNRVSKAHQRGGYVAKYGQYTTPKAGFVVK